MRAKIPPLDTDKTINLFLSEKLAKKEQENQPKFITQTISNKLKQKLITDFTKPQKIDKEGTLKTSASS